MKVRHSDAVIVNWIKSLIEYRKIRTRNNSVRGRFSRSEAFNENNRNNQQDPTHVTSYVYVLMKQGESSTKIKIYLSQFCCCCFLLLYYRFLLYFPITNSVWDRFGRTHKQLLSNFQNSAELTEKHLQWNPIFSKVAGPQSFYGAPLKCCFWMKRVYFQERIQMPVKNLRWWILR